MSSGNSGEQLLKIMLKVVWWIILLIPSIVKIIYNGIMWIINKITNKEEEVVHDEMTNPQE